MLAPDDLIDKIDPVDFELFTYKGIKIFIQRELLNEEKISFFISRVGRFYIEFENS